MLLQIIISFNKLLLQWNMEFVFGFRYDQSKYLLRNVDRYVHQSLSRTIQRILPNAIAYLSFIIMYTPVLDSSSSIWTSFVRARVSLLKFRQLPSLISLFITSSTDIDRYCSRHETRRSPRTITF